jgi:flagellar biosynthesis protein FliQ
MDESFVISLAQNAVVLTVLIAAPFLLISLLIGSWFR